MIEKTPGKIINFKLKDFDAAVMPAAMIGASVFMFVYGALWARYGEQLKLDGGVEASEPIAFLSKTMFFLAGSIGVLAANAGMEAVEFNFDGELAGKKAAQFVKKIPPALRNAVTSFENFVDKTSRREPADPGDNYWPYAEHKPGESGFE
jgi:hypothetical protein